MKAPGTRSGQQSGRDEEHRAKEEDDERDRAEARVHGLAFAIDQAHRRHFALHRAPELAEVRLQSASCLSQ
jgi:hypothetical protein